MRPALSPLASANQPVWEGSTQRAEAKGSRQGLVAANVAISTAVSRIADSYARHGFAATVHRAVVAAKRAVFSGRSVLFYSDLAAQVVPPAELPSFLAVERKQSSAELDPIDLEAMTGFWNSKLAQRNVKERFEKGGRLSG